MSTGPRIPLADAQKLAAWLFNRWGLDAKVCFTVGSVRRQRETVGDLEIIAPLRPKQDDPEYDRIAASMDGYARQSMFDAPAGPTIGRAIRGLSPGFNAACLEIDTNRAGAFPVQVYRYTPANFGWIMLMRTGPRDFGEWFLGRWKDSHGISRGDPRFRGSIDGHLVDASCKVVPVRTEEEAFARIGVKFVPPERRSAYIEHIKAGRVA